MWETISGRGGLEADFDELSLSHGQQQLFCLAWAILSKSSIVLLDEATSSVDQKTDEQDPKTIGDLDVVVVMDKDRLVEIGDLRQLREQPGSLFKTLWDNRHG
ncbi:hypothetical protein GQ53DRAFT_819664 [Thozetella sp. PMI_491]|nr:hypothetical protein GQ53DRAFT_819664 [Thozetella sp. PMI_491]